MELTLLKSPIPLFPSENANLPVKLFFGGLAKLTDGFITKVERNFRQISLMQPARIRHAYALVQFHSGWLYK